MLLVPSALEGVGCPSLSNKARMTADCYSFQKFRRVGTNKARYPNEAHPQSSYVIPINNVYTHMIPINNIYTHTIPINNIYTHNV